MGNAFNNPLYIPAIDVQYLSGTNSNNLSFQSIYIQPDSLTPGQSVALDLIGTQNQTSLRYDFPGNFTIEQGASLSVGPNVPVQLGAGYTPTTLADNGTLTFANNDTVSLNDQWDNGVNYYSQIVVGSGGLLNATSTAFNDSGGGGINGIKNAQIDVNSGGQSSIPFEQPGYRKCYVQLQHDGHALSSDIFSGVLTVNSDATLSIHGNDFSNVGAQGIVAVGDPTATIDMTANFWGTSTASQIQAKILDHYADPTTRPTVDFGSYLGTAPAAITGVVFNDLNGNGVQDSGEAGLGGVVVYIDQNNSGSLVSSDPSTVTSTTGLYSFNGLAAGTYVVREVPPSGTVETVPSSSAVASTIDFDGTGGESGITGAGVSLHLSWRQLLRRDDLRPGSGQTALLASGTLAYNASTSPSCQFQPARQLGDLFLRARIRLRVNVRRRHGLRRGWQRRRECEQQGRNHERRPGQLRDAHRLQADRADHVPGRCRRQFHVHHGGEQSGVLCDRPGRPDGHWN